MTSIQKTNSVAFWVKEFLLLAFDMARLSLLMVPFSVWFMDGLALLFVLAHIGLFNIEWITHLAFIEQHIPKHITIQMNEGDIFALGAQIMFYGGLVLYVLRALLPRSVRGVTCMSFFSNIRVVVMLYAAGTLSVFFALVIMVAESDPFNFVDLIILTAFASVLHVFAFGAHVAYSMFGFLIRRMREAEMVMNTK